jgi:Zn ribbon nucleic-acid-binding protein
MSELRIEITCPSCSTKLNMPFSEISGEHGCCPECGAPVPVTDEQIDAAVEKRIRSDRKAMKPKFGMI